MFKGHIHTHTEYSMLDGMAKIEELIIRAKELGQECIAITDHGSSSGLYSAYKLGVKHNFNVLLGEEFYMENSISALKTGHLILIAKNNTGLSNLFCLQEKAYKNFYYKPRVNIDMLNELNEGLICTTACIANAVGQLILMGEDTLALNEIIKLKNIFGDDFYVEIQSSTNPDVIKVNEKLIDWIRKFGFKCIITTDIHYVNKEDYAIHEVLLAMQQQKKMGDKKRWRFEHNDYYLKSEEEMKVGIPEDIFDMCCKYIEEIAEKCKGVTIERGNYLPKYLPTTSEEDMELAKLALEGYKNKVVKRNQATKNFLKDIYKELDIIAQTGYSGYFLTVREYVMWARENGILVGDGRGSGAGSKVAYAIGITDVNPDAYDLLFERFLSIGREPDFDVDFSDIDAVFKHLQDRYGETNVARVGAYTKFTCKSCVKKVMSCLGYSQKDIKAVVDMMPDLLSFSLEEARNLSNSFKNWIDNHEDVYSIVRRLEGMVEHFSTHAGGVIICEGLTEILPTFTQSEDRSKLIVAMDKKEIESLGHYKFDILGLESLTLMKNIEDYSPQIDWHSIDYNTPEIYDMICSGDVLGIFQLSGQADKVKEQQPKNFNDLIAINALIRPGVCDWNTYLQRRAERDDEKYLPFMKETHGLIVYQEQYELLAQHYAGWDIAYSDKHIRKNKNITEDTELFNKWLTDTSTNGYSKEEMMELWDEICGIVNQGYSFNKSHATSYAVLSFRTAYMKYHYPEAFYSAYLTQNNGKNDKMNEAINKVKSLGIKLLSPDINISTDKFIPTEEGIMLPINSIKGVGGSVITEINRLKPIKDFDDFLERRIKKFVKKTAIEQLIKAGAFDFTNKSREELLEQFTGEKMQTTPYYQYEKSAFGFYINDSPFSKYSIKDIDEYADGQQCMTICELVEITPRYDRRGNEMAFAIGVNDINTMRLVIFSSMWQGMNVREGDLVFVKGKKDKASIIVNAMEVM